LHFPWNHFLASRSPQGGREYIAALAFAPITSALAALHRGSRHFTSSLLKQPSRHAKSVPGFIFGRRGRPVVPFLSSSPNARGGAPRAHALDFARAARVLPGDLAQEAWRILARMNQRFLARHAAIDGLSPSTAAGPDGAVIRREVDPKKRRDPTRCRPGSCASCVSLTHARRLPHPAPPSRRLAKTLSRWTERVQHRMPAREAQVAFSQMGNYLFITVKLFPPNWDKNHDLSLS